MSKAAKTFLWMGICIVVLALAGFGYSALKENYAAPTASPSGSALSAAQDFSVQNAQGEEVRLSSYFGKPIILNFWATWCPNCDEEMPGFQEAYEIYGDRIHILMIDETDGRRETKEKAEAYLKKQGYTFPVLYDTQLTATQIYAPRYLPTTVFIDKEGRVLHTQEGMISKDVLGKWIETLLK